MNKKLLIISYYLPPIKTVAGVRISNFHIEAQKHFKDVFAMTTSNRHLFPKEDYNFDDSKTTEIRTWDLRYLLNKRKKPTIGLSQSVKKNRFTRFVSKLSYTFPTNLLIDDGGLTYIIGGFFKGKKLVKENDINILFSSYKPYADHIICFLLKIWNPKLIWVADFRDLHIDEIRNNAFFPKIQKWFNRKILKKADVVTTVSDGLKKNLEELHPNIYVLRNGIPSGILKQKKQSFYKKFTIAYTGSLYPKLQTANIFFKVIQKLIQEKKIKEEDFQIIYAGKENDVWQNWIDSFQLQNISTIYGLLPKEEANIIQQQSHINILLSWATLTQKGILTAKFYDYLLAQNPILLLIKGIQDEEFEKIFDDVNCGMIAYENTLDETRIKNFILGYYSKWKETGTIANPINEEKLTAFQWDDQMEKFMNFLNTHFE